VSTRTLQTLHKAHHGMSASAFIRERRMQRAKALLAEGPASIGNVAEAIGYSNAANFSRDFRKRFGRAPSMILRSPD
jgi:transcriptional regulator GlxA family with amidase domain